MAASRPARAGRACRAATAAGLPALDANGPGPRPLPGSVAVTAANPVTAGAGLYDVRAPPPELPPLNIPSHARFARSRRATSRPTRSPARRRCSRRARRRSCTWNALTRTTTRAGSSCCSNEEYEQLKLDLDFEGSKVAVYSKDEIKFVLSNKRYAMGKPIMSDSEYDSLRTKLKDLGSLVVLHDGASCSLETGQCKTDMRVDNAKLRLLYCRGRLAGCWS